jgi:hypothetical protein
VRAHRCRTRSGIDGPGARRRAASRRGAAGPGQRARTIRDGHLRGPVRRSGQGGGSRPDAARVASGSGALARAPGHGRPRHRVSQPRRRWHPGGRVVRTRDPRGIRPPPGREPSRRAPVPRGDPLVGGHRRACAPARGRTRRGLPPRACPIRDRRVGALRHPDGGRGDRRPAAASSATSTVGWRRCSPRLTGGSPRGSRNASAERMPWHMRSPRRPRWSGWPGSIRLPGP